MPVPHGGRLWIILALILLLSGCGAKELVFGDGATRINTRIVASESVNPDIEGRASPVVVRAYLLRDPTAFQDADFFALYQNEAGTLGQDLVERFEFQLEPGETLDREFQFEDTSQVTHLGLIAAFRDLDEAQWRQVYAPDLGERNRLTVTLDTVSIKLADD